MNLKDILILIIDDNFDKEDPLVFELKELFKNALIMQAEEGITFILENLGHPLIVLLDISMPHHLDGHQTLNEIRKKTFNIPVILFSAIDEKEEAFSDFINNRVAAYIRKDESSENVINKIKEIVMDFEFQLDNALEDWIEKQPEEIKKKPFMKTSDGKVLSYEDLLTEIRLETPTGKKMKKDIQNLAIDLFQNPNNF